MTSYHPELGLLGPPIRRAGGVLGGWRCPGNSPGSTGRPSPLQHQLKEGLLAGDPAVSILFAKRLPMKPVTSACTGLMSPMLGESNNCLSTEKGFPGGATDKEPAFQCRWHNGWQLDPWVRKIPWRRKQKATPVFLPREFHGQRSLWATVHSVTKSRTRLKHTHRYRENTFIWQTLVPGKQGIWEPDPVQEWSRALKLLTFMPTHW